jgi:hypothetical protein
LDVCVDARFINKPDEENEYNSATHTYLEFLVDFLPKIEIVKAQPMFVGRAAESLSKRVKKKSISKILDGKCPGPWAGGTLESPLGVDVDQHGFVTMCPGLSIGNARKISFRRIINEYDCRDFAVIDALQYYGMEGLMKLASENGFVPKEAYADECHFCYETRKFLSKRFPEALVLKH